MLVELRCQLGAMDVLGDAEGRGMLVELRCQLGAMDVFVGGVKVPAWSDGCVG